MKKSNIKIKLMRYKYKRINVLILTSVTNLWQGRDTPGGHDWGECTTFHQSIMSAEVSIHS